MMTTYFEETVIESPSEMGFTTRLKQEIPEEDNETDLASYDPIQIEFGPYFIVKGENVKPNPRAIVANFSSQRRIVFWDEAKTFLQYEETTGVWENITKDQLKYELGNFYGDLAIGANKKELAYTAGNSFFSSLVEVLKGWQLPNQREHNPKLFPVTNGVLDFNTIPPALKPNSAEYFFQHRAQFKWDSEAVCPQFKAFLSASLLEEDISLIQRYCGSMFLGRNSDQKILVLKGTPGGGKSTLVTILEQIVGLKNVANLRTQHLGGRFEFSGFLGKRLLTGKDVPGDTLSLKSAQFLKSLVGGDLLQAEFKYAGKAEVWGKFHVVIACNNSLRIALDNDEGAWRRRLLIVRYDRPTIDKPIHDLAEKLIREEGEGILAWLVQGAIAHAKEVDEKVGYQLTDRQKEAIESLIGESQSVRRFVETQVEKGTNPCGVSTKELLDGYIMFCKKQCWTPLAEAKVQKDIPSLMVSIHQKTQSHDLDRDSKSVRGYKQVKLLK